MREEPSEFIWLDGRIVPWTEAKLHVHTQCVLGGLNVYEGLKAYWSEEEEQLFVFRFEAHLTRLARSMKVVRIPSAYTLDELKQATIDLLAANQFRQSVSIRIVCYFGEGVLFGFLPEEVETGAFIYATTRSGMPSADQGIHSCVSSWHRISDLSAPPRVKSGANYQNARLAQVQARVDGYDEPILLNDQGGVTEAPLRNVFIVRNGVLITPDLASGILEGVTRDTIIELARDDVNLRVEERRVDRTELYVADEVFLASSSVEILPVLSVDRLPVGDGRPGPISRMIYDALADVGSGGNPRYRHWLTPVYGRVGQEARATALPE